MTHATFMRASRAYNQAVQDNNITKARHALVRLVGVSVRQYKGKPVKGVHMLPMLTGVRKFGAKHMRNARAALVKDGYMEEPNDTLRAVAEEMEYQATR